MASGTGEARPAEAEKPKRPIITSDRHGTWWCVTGYHVVGNQVMAETKWDITQSIDRIQEEAIHLAMHPAVRQN